MKNIEFDVDKFIKEQDDMNVLAHYRVNEPAKYNYIKILFEQAYLFGGIDTLDSSIIKFKD